MSLQSNIGARSARQFKSARIADGENRRRVIQRAVDSSIELLEQRRMLSTTLYHDDYSKDTSANYTQQDQTAPPTLVDSWTVANGTLNYDVAATNGWNSSVFLLKPSVASTAGLLQFPALALDDLVKDRAHRVGFLLAGRRRRV